MTLRWQLSLATFSLLFVSCTNYFKNDYKDNSPTSGQLQVFCEEAIEGHVRNQASTFESHYERAQVRVDIRNEAACIEALYKDSCEAIFIERSLAESELKAFSTKDLHPVCVPIAQTGIAILCNNSIALNKISVESIKELLTSGKIKDSAGQIVSPIILFDSDNSSVLHFMLDSILQAKRLASNCRTLKNTAEEVEFVRTHPAIAFLDFAWISDLDDPHVKKIITETHLLAVSKTATDSFELPSQTSFKLGVYPLRRTIYYCRKTGDFTLAKGFESFVYGPKGQLLFLKQGLMPTRQSERQIEIKMDSKQQ